MFREGHIDLFIIWLRAQKGKSWADHITNSTTHLLFNEPKIRLIRHLYLQNEL